MIRTGFLRTVNGRGFRHHREMTVPFHSFSGRPVVLEGQSPLEWTNEDRWS